MAGKNPIGFNIPLDSLPDPSQEPSTDATRPHDSVPLGGEPQIEVLDTDPMESSDTDPETLLAYQSIERHRQEKRRKRNIRIAIGAVAAIAALAFAGWHFFGQTEVPEEILIRQDY